VTSDSGTAVTAETTVKKSNVTTVRAVTTVKPEVSTVKDTTTAVTVKNTETSAKKAANSNNGSQTAETTARATTAKVTITTTKTEYTGTFKPDTVTTVTTVTTIPQAEIDRLLAELDMKEERTFATYPRKRQEILGNIPADAPRTSFEEMKQIAAGCETYSEFEVEIERRYPYPDKIWGSGIDHHQFWFDDDGKEYVEFIYDHRLKAICYKTSDEKIALLIAPDLRRMEEIRAKEAENGGKMIRDRAVILGYINESKRHLTLDDFRGFTADPMEIYGDDFSGFWKRLNNVELYPDVWMNGEELCLIYGIYGSEDYVMVYPESGTAEYRKHDDPDFSETIISGRGTVSADDIQKIVKRMNNIINMAE